MRSIAMKYWIPKRQAWMTLDEVLYHASLATAAKEDAALLVRETPASKVEQWRAQNAHHFGK